MRLYRCTARPDDTKRNQPLERSVTHGGRRHTDTAHHHDRWHAPPTTRRPTTEQSAGAGASTMLRYVFYSGSRVRAYAPPPHAHVPLTHVGRSKRHRHGEYRGQWMEKGEGNRGEIEVYRRHRASADFQPHHPRDTITPSFLSTSSSSSSPSPSPSSSSLISRRRYCSAANLKWEKEKLESVPTRFSDAFSKKEERKTPPSDGR